MAWGRRREDKGRFCDRILEVSRVGTRFFLSASDCNRALLA